MYITIIYVYTYIQGGLYSGCAFPANNNKSKVCEIDNIHVCWPEMHISTNAKSADPLWVRACRCFFPIIKKRIK